MKGSRRCFSMNSHACFSRNLGLESSSGSLLMAQDATSPYMPCDNPCSPSALEKCEISDRVERCSCYSRWCGAKSRSLATSARESRQDVSRRLARKPPTRKQACLNSARELFCPRNMQGCRPFVGQVGKESNLVSVVRSWVVGLATKSVLTTSCNA